MDFRDKFLYVWDKIDNSQSKNEKNYWIFILENVLNVKWNVD
ncbi:hypothetical protein ES702_05216 [subsurface metagenome]